MMDFKLLISKRRLREMKKTMALNEKKSYALVDGYYFSSTKRKKNLLILLITFPSTTLLDRLMAHLISQMKIDV